MKSSSGHNIQKKIQVSLILSDLNEKAHRSGVNALQFDHFTNLLYSAGRDSVIRVWSNDRFIQNMEHHTDWVNDIVLCANGRYCKFLNILFKNFSLKNIF